MKKRGRHNEVRLFVFSLLSVIAILLNVRGEVCAEVVSISNNRFDVTFDSDKGVWSCDNAAGENIIHKAMFLIITENGEKYFSSSEHYQKSIEKASGNDILGKGQSLKIRFSPDQDDVPEAVLALYLHDDESFISLDVEVKNVGSSDMVIKEIQPVKLNSNAGGFLNFEGSPDKLSSLNNDGSFFPELVFFDKTKGIGSYTNIALYNRETKKSLVSGFLYNRKAINLMSLQLEDEKSDVNSSFDFTASSYFVYNKMESGKSVSTGRMIIDLPDNVFEGLEHFGKLLAEVNDIILPENPLNGWCSWYYIYPDITEEEVIKNADFLEKELKDYGLEYIQVDRGRVETGYDWIVSNSKFPHDMPWLAEQLHNKGFKAGIWFAPLWLGRESKHYNEDWFVEKISTRPKQEGKRRRHWGSWGDKLDTSNDEVIDYLKNFIGTVADEWDYDYLKHDFLQYGLPENNKLHHVLLEKGEITGVKQFFRTNTDITPVEAYVNGVAAIREAAGDETFIMGCSHTYIQSLGFIDGFRIVNDIESKLHRTFEGTTRSQVIGSARKYYFNGSVIWNDIDCLIVRDPFTIDQARVRAALASLSGGMLMTSDKMYMLSPEKIKIVSKTFPQYPVAARPLDLFEVEMPTVWLWEINKDFENWHVLGVFNYADTTVNREITYDYLGLDSSKEYIMYDFWDKIMPTRSSRYHHRSLMPFAEDMAIQLAPNSCKVIAIRVKKAHPQIVSTNRHLTQGAVDLENVMWDEETKTLTGSSKLVRNDDYEMIVTLPKNMKFVKAAVSNRVSCNATLGAPDVDRYNTVNISLKSNKNRVVEWSVLFEEK